MRLGQGDGIFRIGNAAGEAHPIVGEGISMAIQSAFVLAALLGPARRRLVDPDSAADAQATLLREYEARWRQRFGQRLRVAAAFAHLAMRPGAAAAAWPVVRAWPGLLTHGARWSGKTRCVPEAAQLVAQGGARERAAGRVRRLSLSRCRASAACVAASAGRKVSSASSESSTSFGVPNTVVVLMNESRPSGLSNTRGTTTSLPPPCGATRSASGCG